MSRLLALAVVAASAFACAPRPLTVVPAEPLTEIANVNELFLVDGELEVEVPVWPYHDGCLPEMDRFDKQTRDEIITADWLGSPPPLELQEFRAPREPTYPSRGPRRNPLWQVGRKNGASADSERAVARGLAWLKRQQHEDGSWVFDGTDTEDRVAATGLALLPFLRAGVTHKRGEDDREPFYQKTVAAGIGFLMKRCQPSGPNAGRMSNNMASQAIATLALCEAYNMTKDPLLKPYAQAALNCIQKSQGPNGSWGETPVTNGDIFTVGWVVQALHAGRLTGDLTVDDRVIQKTLKFLDLVSAGPRKSLHGIVDNTDAKPGTTPTAIGLLCRYNFEMWRPSHPGMIDGVGGLMKNPPSAANRDPVYLYYATQVVHNYEGDDWKDWNEGPKSAEDTRKGGVRDLLVSGQWKKDGPTLGSWDADAGTFGKRYGRLGTTALSVLTLETYYRHLPPSARPLAK